MYAWKTWSERLSDKVGFAVAEDRKQIPGQVAQEVIDGLEDQISSLPPRTKYHKAK